MSAPIAIPMSAGELAAFDVRLALAKALDVAGGPGTVAVAVGGTVVVVLLAAWLIGLVLDGIWAVLLAALVAAIASPPLFNQLLLAVVAAAK